MRYARPYLQKQRLAITPSEVVDIDIAWSSKVEDDAAFTRLSRSVDLMQFSVSKSLSFCRCDGNVDNDCIP